MNETLTKFGNNFGVHCIYRIYIMYSASEQQTAVEKVDVQSSSLICLTAAAAVSLALAIGRLLSSTCQYRCAKCIAVAVEVVQGSVTARHGVGMRKRGSCKPDCLELDDLCMDFDDDDGTNERAGSQAAR
jgi:hypothetical protein